MKQLFNFILFSLLLVFLSSASFHIQKGRLNVGDTAPKFKVKNVQGKSIKLKTTLKEHSKTLIVFLRHAWCPVCNVRTHELLNNFETLTAKGYGVIVVYESKKEYLVNYVNDYQLPYTVIADPEGKLYQQYKVEYNKQKVKNNIGQGDSETNKLFKQGIGLYKKNYKEYLAEGEEGSGVIPADFIINKNGKIEIAYYGNFLGDHLPLAPLLAAPTDKKSVKKHVRF